MNEVLDGVDQDLLDEDEEDDGPSDYGMLNPDLIDLNSDEQGDPSQPSTVLVSSGFLENESLPTRAFYEMYSLWNEEQPKLFSFIMIFSRVTLEKRNDLSDPSPFQIFLSGGATIGK